MNIDELETILVDRLDAEQDNSAFRLPDDAEVSALLKTGSELMHVNKLRLIDFGDEVTTLVTRESEYFVDAADVFALKLESSRIQPVEARPGFRRDGS